MAHAFRCTNCGKLVTAEAAGENPVPGSCPACGKGVDHSSGRWQPVEGHWEVLADATKTRIKELTDYHGDLEVEEHSVKEWPAQFGALNVKSIAVEAHDAPGSEDENG